MSDDALPVPGKDGLFLACEEVARTVLWRQGEKSSDVVETLAQSFYEIACEHRQFVRETCETDDVIENAVRYLATVHAVPPSRTDTRWFSTSMTVLIEIAVPNALIDELTGKNPSDVRRHIGRLKEAGITGNGDLMAPLFQMTNRKLTARDHLQESGMADTSHAYLWMRKAYEASRERSRRNTGWKAPSASVVDIRQPKESLPPAYQLTQRSLSAKSSAFGW